MNKLLAVESEQLRSDLEKFGPGDTLKVYFRIHEGKKDKVQAFQGVCIQIKGSGPNTTFTLRKISQGVGIERIFPIHSPVIEKIEVVRFGKVRRAKLYYLRDKTGKGRVVKERIVSKEKTEKKRRATKVVKQKSAETPVEDVEAQETQTKSEEPAVKTPPKEEQDAASQSGSGGLEED